VDGPTHPPMLSNNRHTFRLRSYDAFHSGTSRRRWRRNAAADLFWIARWMLVTLVALTALAVVRGDLQEYTATAVFLLEP